MNFVETLLIITSGLSIALVVAFLQVYERLSGLKNDKKALKAEIAELNRQLKKQVQKDEVALRGLKNYYDDEVERQKKEVEGFHADRIEELQKLLEIYRDSNEAGNLVMEFDDTPPKK